MLALQSKGNHAVTTPNHTCNKPCLWIQFETMSFYMAPLRQQSQITRQHKRTWAHKALTKDLISSELTHVLSMNGEYNKCGISACCLCPETINTDTTTEFQHLLSYKVWLKTISKKVWEFSCSIDSPYMYIYIYIYTPSRTSNHMVGVSVWHVRHQCMKYLCPMSECLLCHGTSPKH